MAAVIVLIPGSPLGLLTVAVQVLAGILLPSAVVFLLLLCNDKQVLGPWVNGKWLNIFTSAVIAILVMLSIVLTSSVLFPDISGETILWILGIGSSLALLFGVGFAITRRARSSSIVAVPIDRTQRTGWRMLPLSQLTRPEMSPGRKIGLTVLRGYLLIAMLLVIVRVVQLALGH